MLCAHAPPLFALCPAFYGLTMKFIALVIKIAIFVALLGFALNNQGMATVYFLLDMQWTAPLVLILLSAFCGGLIAGICVMISPWWAQRTRAKRLQAQLDAAAQAATQAPTAAHAVADVGDITASTSDTPVLSAAEAARHHGI